MSLLGLSRIKEFEETLIILRNGLYESLGVLASHAGFQNKVSYVYGEFDKNIETHKKFNKYFSSNLPDFFLDTIGVVIEENRDNYALKLLSKNERNHRIDERYYNASPSDIVKRFHIITYCKSNQKE